MENLVKAESGASRVVVFDHTLRTGDDAMRQQLKIREVVPRVHNDYTEWSAPQRRARHSTRRSRRPAQAAFRGRAGGVRWPPPVESSPLAMCDARSISLDDLVISERRYPGRVGQTYAIVYNPDHKWFWFPRMRRDEAIVFKVLTRRKTAARAGPRIRASTIPPRRPTRARAESIEIRTLAFF